MYSKYFWAKNISLSWQHIDNNVYIIDHQNNEIYKLIDVGKHIWLEIDGRKNIEQIAFTLIQIYDVSLQELSKDIHYFLDYLNMLELVLKSDKPFSGLFVDDNY